MTQDLRVPSQSEVILLAARAGFEICGVAEAGPSPDFARYRDWVGGGRAGAMGYLMDYRAERRETVRALVPEAASVICVGKLYNGPEPYSTAFNDAERGWIARYAWGEDYHAVMHRGLEQMAQDLLGRAGPFEWKACVDTAPVLERSLARDAGLGWIGKNTCLINQERGSWFFLGELITSLPLEANTARATDRCGTCMQCIEACPTDAIVPAERGRYQVDARLCISYLTIELKGTVDEALRGASGQHVFGCDICQDVCPWNRRAQTGDEVEQPGVWVAPPLERLAGLSEIEFRDLFRGTAVERTRYRGFLRNVAIAMGNSRSAALLKPLEKLAESADALVAEHARWALGKLKSELGCEAERETPCAETFSW